MQLIVRAGAAFSVLPRQSVCPSRAADYLEIGKP